MSLLLLQSIARVNASKEQALKSILKATNNSYPKADLDTRVFLTLNLRMRGYTSVPNMQVVTRSIPWKHSRGKLEQKSKNRDRDESGVGIMSLVDLSLNEISAIDNLQPLSSTLLSLNLSRNLIGAIKRMDTFQYLLELDLSNNNIRVVQGLKHLPLLHSLVRIKKNLNFSFHITCY